jgi:chloramphenicol-sensitive protein RarD
VLAARKGYLFGILAYLIWGLFPLYWKLLRPSDALEILAHRIVWSFVAVAVVVAATRGWRRIGALMSQPRKLATIALAATLITLNGDHISGSTPTRWRPH